jgi:Tfp pilus assembly protein PilZ
MEKPLITIVDENEALIKLQAVLPPLGFRVRMFLKLSDFMSAPEKTSSEAIILDGRSAEALILLTESGRLLSCIENRPVIIISEAGNMKIYQNFPSKYFELPYFLPMLFRFFQENLPVFRREHMRLKTSLPGIYCHGEGCHVAEIMSLGTGGAFIKTGWHQLENNDLVRIGIPLLGMNKELEIEGRVVYLIEPNEENKYLQGVGVCFTRPETETVCYVEDYIRYFLQEELLKVDRACVNPALNFLSLPV